MERGGELVIIMELQAKQRRKEEEEVVLGGGWQKTYYGMSMLSAGGRGRYGLASACFCVWWLPPHPSTCASTSQPDVHRLCMSGDVISICKYNKVAGLREKAAQRQIGG